MKTNENNTICIDFGGFYNSTHSDLIDSLIDSYYDFNCMYELLYDLNFLDAA